MKPRKRRKTQTRLDEHWMFLASGSSFLIATILEVVNLAITGISIHTGLVGHQGLALLEKHILLNDQLFKPNLILAWTSTVEVRALNKMSLNSSEFICCQS